MHHGMTTFDPNDTKQPEAPSWATYVPGRSGKAFKVYTKRAHALNSFTYAANAILYRRDGDQWVEVHRVEEDRQNWGGGRCACGAHAHRRWVDLDTDQPRTAYICYACRHA